MKIEILGMGCIKCKKLYENAMNAVNELGVKAEIVKVEELDKIVQYGILATPAIVVDGKIKLAGRIATVKEIKEWIA